jgi:hypothetical protein
MKSKMILAAILAVISFGAMAKLPPAPPVDPKVAEEKAAKDKATAEKTKADQARYEDRAVASFQAKMKKAGKPVPKPTPVVAPAAPATVAAPAAKPAVALPPAKK